MLWITYDPDTGFDPPAHLYMGHAYVHQAGKLRRADTVAFEVMGVPRPDRVTYKDKNPANVTWQNIAPSPKRNPRTTTPGLTPYPSDPPTYQARVGRKGALYYVGTYATQDEAQAARFDSEHRLRTLANLALPKEQWRLLARDCNDARTLFSELVRTLPTLTPAI